jgi:hypothetical protein
VHDSFAPFGDGQMTPNLERPKEGINEKTHSVHDLIDDTGSLHHALGPNR